ncbi:DUF4148 domain-containing protein [Roseateles toxinivorans]|uniref:Uncharacterized protein DUF4148 n=1 Tax=Roseateles toxinivorans TaxID=270368 RepID=A0A4R6QM46_9BURK|nr:DUF4148 domain-containing protein [Roseateles toxinivorans]TDP71383.1 uncharacterized protein DUF4148 [Roseateles toxinivorans]
MKNLTIFAAALLAATVAMADAPTNTQLTRDQVVAELVRARASGELTAMNSENTAEFTGGALVATAKTRAQVLAELKRAQGNGELAALQADGADAGYLAKLKPAKADPVVAGKSGVARQE